MVNPKIEHINKNTLPNRHLSLNSSNLKDLKNQCVYYL